MGLYAGKKNIEYNFQLQYSTDKKRVAIKITHALIFLGLVISFISVASAISGIASYYDPSIGVSACGTVETGLVAAVGDALWNNGAVCGKMYRVTCTGPTNQCRSTGASVTVKIVEHCPGCAANRLDLSPQAFSAISDPAIGKINIDFVQ
ncbi:putative EG45-like domain containing protein 1 [Morella rubra]|uniref:Putative EG45-like domain containing protein 1 n=1 Tax=Morella rubra TaxID=262757 RepID=A0A6A1UNJ5_9ROSI|nr:putative EG45-like domain containing protein 1 [Morella rubra]